VQYVCIQVEAKDKNNGDAKLTELGKLRRPKDTSRDLQANCAISFYFRLYLMLHACASRFNVTGNFEKFLVFGVN
jgi:hypothetical protein